MTYTLTLAPDERRTLAWLADRYECARVLYDAMERVDEHADETDTCEYRIPEHVAWSYIEELDRENGCGVAVPPCCGGALAEKLLKFREQIV